MHDLATLSVLQERLRRATGPDREIDAGIHFAFVSMNPDPDPTPRYTAGVDAALALVTKHLPGVCGHVAFGNIPEARLYYNHSEEPIGSFGATPALALLSALLCASAALAGAPTPAHDL